MIAGVIEIKPVDLKYKGQLFTIHGYETKNGEQLAEASQWWNGYELYARDYNLRKESADELKKAVIKTAKQKTQPHYSLKMRKSKEGIE